jgi:carbonic anhydrase/acetyltransferase-like protein (isoleucine patch superfamily)
VEDVIRRVAVYALGNQVPVVDPSAYVHPDAVVIGSVTVGAESTIWPGAVLRGDYGEIRIGARTSIQDGTVVHATAAYPTVVGDDCVVGHLAHLEGCVVENGALVGSGSVVLHRATIGAGALVGANAVVSNNVQVPPRAMALGVPAKIREGAATPDLIAIAAQQYVANGKRYRAELRRIDS